MDEDGDALGSRSVSAAKGQGDTFTRRGGYHRVKSTE
jgi:hypothetical protein